MKNNRIWFIIILAGIYMCLASNGYVFSQSLTKSEIEYRGLTEKINREHIRLDSLNKIYNKEIRKIEIEKKKPSPNQKAIESIMSGAVVISNSIEKTQSGIEILSKEIENKKKFLDKLYTEKIDSLKRLEADKNFSGNKAMLSVEILSLIEKRQIVKPTVGSLSYNPDELVGIDISSIEDDGEKKIFIEYITSALDETDKQLAVISKENSRLEEMLSLKKKVDDFIEDTDFRTNIAGLKTNNQAGRSPDSYDRKNGFVNESDVLAPQAFNFTILLDQLKFSGIATKIDQSKINQYVKGANRISLEEYKELLTEVAYRLTAYRTILNNKLKNADNAR